MAKNPTLTLRKMEIDFTHARVHWNPEAPEYCQLWNAFSAGIPALERFLIKVMRKAKAAMPQTADPDLVRDIDMFIGQEGQHYRLHEQFNKLLYAEGYAAIEPAVAKLEADYNHFFEHKGLKFCLAYCEGFETIGPMVASFFFNRAPDLMRNWHEPTTYLWLWHMAEEYEHRVVTNYTLRELYESYWYRVYGMWYAAIHLFGFALGVAGKLIQEDRAKGRIRGKWASRFRYGKVLFRVFGHFFGHYVTAHRPTYDPATIPAPSRATELLAEIGENKTVRIPQED